MHTSFHHLDRHFDLPELRTVTTRAPLQWLYRGWMDLTDNLAVSLSYGLALSVLGYLILAYLAGQPYLVTAAVSGFFLVGPIAAAGLYEVSRCHAKGQRTGLTASLRGLGNHASGLFYFGLFLALVLLAWERISAVLFALFYHGDIASVEQLFDTLMSAAYLGFMLTYLVVGGMLAALVFTLSVVSIPLLMERDTDIITAMMTSFRAVVNNPGAMVLWAGLILVLVGIGFATMMLAMVVALPLLGHASWHAYKDLVE